MPLSRPGRYTPVPCLNLATVTVITPSPEQASAASAQGLRLVLITNGIRPLTERFTELHGAPIGVISWDSSRAGGLVEHVAQYKWLARLYALLRRRRYASLSHLCRENQLRYVSIEKSQPEVLEQVLTDWKPELVITSGCPMVPVHALSSVPHGGINLHPSLLPAYRGADPIAWQIIDQVSHLGVSVHRLSQSYDTGTILGQTELPRPQGVNRVDLARTLEGDVGFELLNQVIDNLVEPGNLTETVQPEASPTRQAKRLSLNLVGDRWKLNDLSADCVWDILKYYNQCPDQWLNLEGWRTSFSWRPVSIQYIDGHESEEPSSHWRVTRKGFTLCLENPLAIITLRAAFRRRNR